MLHIIFLILKILGWILLGILALVLILFGILLLNPVKYKANGSCDGTLESLSANAAVRWLFHLIAAEAEYKDGELKWHLRIAWKKFSSEGDIEEKERDLKNRSQKEEQKAVKQKKETETREIQSTKKKKIEKSDSSDTTTSVISVQHATQQTPSETKKLSGADVESSEPQKKISNNSKTKKEQNDSKKPKEQKEQSVSQVKSEKQVAPKKQNRQTKQKKSDNQDDKDLFERIYDKLTAPFRKLIQKIKYTFQKICDKVKILIRKKERLQAFLTYEIHKSAFAKAVKELKRLLRFLKPKKLKADIEFGFSDPAWTGYMLAVLGIAYPFLGEYAEFRPDFEKKVLRGKACVEGKIRSIYFLIPALYLLLDKNVRTTYRHIRNFKL